MTANLIFSRTRLAGVPLALSGGDPPPRRTRLEGDEAEIWPVSEKGEEIIETFLNKTACLTVSESRWCFAMAAVWQGSPFRTRAGGFR